MDDFLIAPAVVCAKAQGGHKYKRQTASLIFGKASSLIDKRAK